MARHRHLPSLVLAIALAASVWPVNAQDAVGTITGTVLDSSGAALPGATVTVTSMRT
jgi:hypothetical protein